MGSSPPVAGVPARPTPPPWARHVAIVGQKTKETGLVDWLLVDWYK
ncbi:hypothetical protein Hanom_Chr04g00315151 [Helianthus anomalus]